MKRMAIAGFLVLLSLTCAAGSARAQFDIEAEGKVRPADEKGAAQEVERKAWDAWLESLGPGPVYQVEILWRVQETSRLYYLRTQISPAKRLGGKLFGLGIDAKGKIIPPPDPGIQRIRRVMAEAARKPGEAPPPPPLADTTRHLGVWLGKGAAEPRDIMIRSSDVATNAPLPRKPGEIEIAFFGSAVFRVEHIAKEKVKSLAPLREDADEYRRRTQELVKEVVKTRKAELLDDRTLPQAAFVLQEAFLCAAVRDRVSAWIDKSPNEAAKEAPPTALIRATALTSTPDDFALFLKLARRHPAQAHVLLHNTLTMTDRHGTKARDAMALWKILVSDPVPYDHGAMAQKLVELYPEIPRPTFGTLAVAEMARHYDQKLADFNLQCVEPALSEAAKSVRLPEDMLKQLLAFPRADTPSSYGTWIFFTIKDRERGTATAIEWLTHRRAEGLSVE